MDRAGGDDESTMGPVVVDDGGDGGWGWEMGGTRMGRGRDGKGGGLEMQRAQVMMADPDDVAAGVGAFLEALPASPRRRRALKSDPHHHSLASPRWSLAAGAGWLLPLLRTSYYRPRTRTAACNEMAHSRSRGTRSSHHHARSARLRFFSLVLVLVWPCRHDTTGCFMMPAIVNHDSSRQTSPPPPAESSLCLPLAARQS